MSRHVIYTPMAGDAVSFPERWAIEDRAIALGVRVRAGRNTRRDCWKVSVVDGRRATVLQGEGALAAVIAGALDDFEAAA